MAQWVKNLPAMLETKNTQVRSLGWEDPVEKEMATHSNILACKTPWTEKRGYSRRVAKVTTKATEHPRSTTHSGLKKNIT